MGALTAARIGNFVKDRMICLLQMMNTCNRHCYLAIKHCFLTLVYNILTSQDTNL